MNRSIDIIIRQYDFNLGYAKKLVEDIPDDQMAIIPAKGLESHPAFTLGHLVTGSAILIKDMGGEYIVPEGWVEIFERKGPRDQRRPSDDGNLYPSKAEILAELERQHESAKEWMRSTSDEDMVAPFKWRLDHYMPRLIDIVAFLAINHEAMHLGQIAAWRRAMDLPAVLQTV